jgi:pimeloyl-ACP methyl ester carboxylesterase
LLHEPGSFAVHWLRVLPRLVASYRVVAPDLPGHGASEVTDGELDGDRVLAWLGELIEHMCASAPVLIGHLGSGAIAARFAAGQSERLSSLVLVDSFGLGSFRPAPRFALALLRYVARPTPRTYSGLMERCTVDFAAVRAGIAERWEPYQAYTLERARSPAGKVALRVLMRDLAVPAIPPEELGRIAVPTTLIWGRHDPVNRLRIAETASQRYDWPLHVIEDAGDDSPIEQPEAFLKALRTALGTNEPATAMNYRLAYAIGFHPWEDLAEHPPFADKLRELVAREEEGREPPFGKALDIGTGSAVWGILLAKRGWDVTGIDALRRRWNAPTRGLSTSGWSCDCCRLT